MRVVDLRSVLCLIALLIPAGHACGQVDLVINTPMSPPEWALLERELLRTNAEACREFFARYFDERGYLLCVERWGGDDGPDDAIENCNDWPHLHALGGADDVLTMYREAWEGHLRQYTEARTTDVPFARDGMYYKEFPVTFDWVHNGEGLSVFNLQGLSAPDGPLFEQRVRRFAGFYMNEDPGAPNYDPEHKIIRSMFNGSRGPLMRKATGLDWAGDPIEVENRFHLGHGERNYAEMVAHFKDYNDIVGDHPQNLVATTLALNALMLTGESKYRRWLLEYVDAWEHRMRDNGGIIPTNIGLDGTIGGECDGKWYGGVYGWGFSVEVPQTGELAHRNTHYLGFAGFMNAYLLTGDDRYLAGWRKQIDLINALAKEVAGQTVYPRMYGDKGWYAWTPQKYSSNALEIWFLSQQDQDYEHVPKNAWVEYLRGNNAGFPTAALRTDLNRIRVRVAGMRADTTTPDTRLADDPMQFNPASVMSLLHLMQGALHVERRGAALFATLRYFDPDRRRAGIPEDVAALVDRLDANSTAVTLVNTNQIAERTVVVQSGGYGEHTIVTASIGDRSLEVNDNRIAVKLGPGCGARIELELRRYSRQPTMTFPWNRVNPLDAPSG